MVNPLWLRGGLITIDMRGGFENDTAAFQRLLLGLEQREERLELAPASYQILA
jgi:hypothetical protein